MRVHLISRGKPPSRLHTYTLIYVGKHSLRQSENWIVREQRRDGWEASKGESPDVVPNRLGQRKRRKPAKVRAS